MVNKYWDPKYSDLIERVSAWNALEEGYYDNRQLRGYNDYKWHDLTEAQIEAQINKAQSDFKKYFYCPRCGRKSLIEEAVTKRKVLNSSLKLDNALMPGWMKIQASSESTYIRLCPDCANKGGITTVAELTRAFDGNAIAIIGERKPAEENAGCLATMATLITVSLVACCMECLIL